MSIVFGDLVDVGNVGDWPAEMLLELILQMLQFEWSHFQSKWDKDALTDTTSPTERLSGEDEGEL